MSDVTIADVMQAYANDAVGYFERRFNIMLDFSERSLVDVDRVLTDLRSGLHSPDRLSDAELDQLWVLCKLIGGYVGEVIIRHVGGQWKEKDDGAGGGSIRLLTTGGVEGSPPEAVWRSLTESSYSIASYYGGLKAILGHGQESIRDGIRTVQLPPLSNQPPTQDALKKRPWWKRR